MTEISKVSVIFANPRKRTKEGRQINYVGMRTDPDPDPAPDPNTVSSARVNYSYNLVVLEDV